MRWNYIIPGLGILFVGSYLDSVRGPLLPVITRSLSLPYAKTSWFLTGGNFAAIFATLLLLPIVQRFREREITFGIALFGVASALYAFGVKDFPTMMGLGVALGCLVAGVGTVCNLLIYKGTDIKVRARFLCALHTMYGLGALSAPLMAGYLLQKGFPWAWIVGLASGGFLLLCVFLAVAVPKEADMKTSNTQSARLEGGHLLVLVTFAIYVGAEVLTSMWMTTYLVESQKLTVASSAPYLTGFFLCMATTRLLCFFFVTPSKEPVVLVGCLITSAAFFLSGHLGWAWGFSLAGFLGPFYPLYLGRVSRRFAESSGPLTVWILTSSQLSLALSHLCVGRLTDQLGIRLTYFLPLVLQGLAIVGLGAYLLWEKRDSGKSSRLQPI